MPADFQIVPQADFSKGVFANSSRFRRPKGTVRRISNLAYKTRGTLQTIDGTLVTASFNGAGPTTGRQPIVWIGSLTRDGVASVLLAIQYNFPAGNNSLLTISGNSYGSLAYAKPFQLGHAIQFGNLLYIATGLATPFQQIATYDGTVLASAGNTWSATNSIPAWQANASAQIDDVTRPTTDNGHIYVCIQTGQTGSTQPTFATGAKATVVDGNAVWQEFGPSSVGGTQAPAAHSLIAHMGFLWAWGTGDPNGVAAGIDSASTLRMSDLQNGGSWNPINSTYLGKSDGQTAQGAAVFAVAEAGIAPTPTLVCFKDYSAYQISGAFPQIQIQLARSDMGNLAPRSIQFVAELGGIVRLTHKGFALFRGVSEGADQVISDSIKDYIFGTSDITGIDWSNANLSMASQSFNPRQYICCVPLVGSAGVLTRAFILDTELKAWTVVDFPINVSTTAYVVLSGSTPITYLGGSSDGTIRRWWYGDADWDGTAVLWNFLSDEVVSGAPTQPFTASRINVRAKPATGAKLTNATLFYDPVQGGSETSTALIAGSGLPTTLPVNRTVQNCAVKLAGSGQVTIESLDWSVKQKPLSRIGVAG